MLNADIQKRIDMDLLSRSIPGIFIYAVVLPGIFWAFDFYTLYPALCLPYIIAMLVVCAARVVHKFLTDALYAKSPRLWLGIFSTLTLLHAGILGSIFALAMYDQRFESVSHMMMLSMAAVAGGALIAQTSRVNLALLNMTVLLAPSFVVCMMHEEKRSFILMLLIYYVYQIALARRTHKEYIFGLSNETKLAEQQQTLEHLNQVDPLTNIYNRGYFNTAYAIQWSIGVRNKQPLSLLMIDADHFKSVNDRYGHLFGDECLKYISKTLQQVVKRETDIIARFGGEEFVVLLSDASTDVAKALAEEVRKAVASEAFSHYGVTHHVTVSVGVASIVPQADINPNTLIDRADKALYQAKEAGRNCIYCDV